MANNQEMNSPKDKLHSMKYEIANQLGVNLKQGYNGNLSSKEAGSIGGEMVKQMIKYASTNMK